MRGAEVTVTIWNKWRNQASGKDEWFRHVIPRCSWEHKAVRAVSGQTASVASSICVLIDENALYRPPREWAGADKARFFTLGLGDLAALGAHTEEITGALPESTLKQRLAPEVFTIRIVQDNTAGYKRGRHYYIEGV